VAGALDLLPAMLVPALVLIALAVFMPFTGAEEARRRQAWARFESLARIRGLTTAEREALAAWARVNGAEAPHLVLSRRQDFDRFVKSEVARLREVTADPAGRRAALEGLARLRERLGLGSDGGRPASSHDLEPGDRLAVRSDAGVRRDVRVTAVDEEGIDVEPLDGVRRPIAGPVWVTFGRGDGTGTYRFRSRPLGRRRALAHGDFLIHEERRVEPRIPLALPPFWLAVERLPDGAAPEDPEGVEVEVLDVSTGGLGLLADRDVRKGSELSLDLPLGGGIVVRDLTARVLGRGYREGGGRRPHFLHCQLDGLDEPQRRVLEAFIVSRIDG